MTREWSKVRTFANDFPEQQVAPFESRQSTFIPDGSITDGKIAGPISPLKIRLIAASIYRSSTQSIADATATAVAFNAISYDTGGFVKSATKLTMPYAGIYTIQGYAEFLTEVAGNYRKGWLTINTVIMQTFSTPPVQGSNNQQLGVSTTLKLAAGDVAEFYVKQDSGGALVINAGSDDNFLSATFLGAT